MEDRIRRLIVGTLFAVAVANGVLLLALVGPTTGWSGARDAAYIAVAAGFALAFGALTLTRHRAPRAILVLATVTVCVYYIVGLPSIGVLLPLVVFLAAATSAGHRWFALGTALVMVAVAAYFRVLGGESLQLVLGYELLSNLVLAILAIVLAEVVGTHRQLKASQNRVAGLAAEAARAETEADLLTERARIARELHDDLGHALAVISLHANAAAERLPPGQPAEESLGHVREASRQAHRHLRQAVRALGRSGAGPEDTGHGLRDVEPVVDRLRAAGLAVEFSHGEAVPRELEAVVFHIVREAATNAVSHARPQHLWISVERDGAAADGPRLVVEVANDGATRPPRDGAGTGGGLADVDSRVRERGGHTDWGFRRPDRFVLRAVLPLGRTGAVRP